MIVTSPLITNLASDFVTIRLIQFRRTFENVYKLLQPGGKALLMFLGWNDGFDAYERLAKYPQYKSYMEVSDRELRSSFVHLLGPILLFRTWSATCPSSTDARTRGRS